MAIINDFYHEKLLFSPNEIERRINSLKEKLAAQKVDYAIILQNADIFYFTGNIQQGVVIISAAGKDVFLVKKNFEFAKNCSSFPEIIPIKSQKEIKNFLDFNKVVGFESDVLPYNVLNFYSKLIQPSKIVDVSNILRQVRAIKSEPEINNIKNAATQLKIVVEKLRHFIEPGMQENEVFNKAIEVLMNAGHQGFARMRGFNQEMFFGHILSGKRGNIASYIDAPTNGVGIYPSFPQGSSNNVLNKGDFLSIDLVGCYNGYHADQTRGFSIGSVDKKCEENFKKAVEIEVETVNIIKPGVSWGEAYKKAFETAKKLKVENIFMGSEYKVKFVGHGVGVEVDEFPFIAPGFNDEFTEDMVFAVEPKLFLPDKGVVGIENTYRITKNGCEKLTDIDNEIVLIQV